MLKITPSLFLKSVKTGGVSYDIPLPLTYWKKKAFACRWVIKLLKMRDGLFTVSAIVDALALALVGEGFVMEKKYAVYYIALSNRHLLRNKFFFR